MIQCIQIQHGNVPPDEPDDGADVPIPDEPDDPLDDDYQPDYQTGPDPDDADNDEEYIIPDDSGPPPGDDMDMPGVAQDSGEMIPIEFKFTHQLPFSNPDMPIEEIADPGDDDPSPGNDPT